MIQKGSSLQGRAGACAQIRRIIWNYHFYINNFFFKCWNLRQNVSGSREKKINEAKEKQQSCWISLYLTLVQVLRPVCQSTFKQGQLKGLQWINQTLNLNPIKIFLESPENVSHPHPVPSDREWTAFRLRRKAVTFQNDSKKWFSCHFIFVPIPKASES